MIGVRRFTLDDAPGLFRLMEEEGTEWQEYYGDAGRKAYTDALLGGIAYVATSGERICGYIRCQPDYGFGIYVYDLLVGEPYRGKEIGKQLIERVNKDYPDDKIYILSDADPYYIKLGYERIGSVFQAKTHSE